MTRNNDLLMVALSRFYAEPEHVAQLMSVLDGKSTVSLRLLDYFVTSYAKRHKTTVRMHNGGTIVCVHSQYRSQLKAFSKQQFDPFRRRERIIFELPDTRAIETTVGQLNFFRWAIESGILQYVVANRSAIEEDMGLTDAPPERPKVPDEQRGAAFHVTTFGTPHSISLS